MNCLEARRLKHAQVDGELDLVRSLEMEEHLSDCAACSREFGNLRALKSALRPEHLCFKAPARLKSRIRASIRDRAPRTPSRAAFWREWLTLSVPTGAIALIALFLWMRLILPGGGGSGEGRLAEEIVSGHVRSLLLLNNQPNHLTDVASSDQHTVKPWFDGKLDFAPPIMDLAVQGFPLVGGRLDYLQGRAVAALVYQRRTHVINLFIWPVSTDPSPRRELTDRRGYHVIHWSGAGMAYWAVSDLGAGELKEFAELIR